MNYTHTSGTSKNNLVTALQKNSAPRHARLIELQFKNFNYDDAFNSEQKKVLISHFGRLN